MRNVLFWVEIFFTRAEWLTRRKIIKWLHNLFIFWRQDWREKKEEIWPCSSLPCPRVSLQPNLVVIRLGAAEVSGALGHVSTTQQDSHRCHERASQAKREAGSVQKANALTGGCQEHQSGNHFQSGVVEVSNQQQSIQSRRRREKSAKKRHSWVINQLDIYKVTCKTSSCLA